MRLDHLRRLPAGAIPILLAISLASYAAAFVSPEDQPPSLWTHLADIKSPPAHALYLGGVRLVAYRNQNRLSAQAHWVVWGKFVYARKQDYRDRKMASEVFGVEINCLKHTYYLFRDIKLNPNDKVIDDSKQPIGPQSYPAQSDALGHLRPAESIVVGAQSVTCGADAE